MMNHVIQNKVSQNILERQVPNNLAVPFHLPVLGQAGVGGLCQNGLGLGQVQWSNLASISALFLPFHPSLALAPSSAGEFQRIIFENFTAPLRHDGKVPCQGVPSPLISHEVSNCQLIA